MFLIRKPVKIIRECSEHGESWYTMEFVKYSVEESKITVRIQCEKCGADWEYFEATPMTWLRLLVQMNENYKSYEQ